MRTPSQPGFPVLWDVTPPTASAPDIVPLPYAHGLMESRPTEGPGLALAPSSIGGCQRSRSRSPGSSKSMSTSTSTSATLGSPSHGLHEPRWWLAGYWTSFGDLAEPIGTSAQAVGSRFVANLNLLGAHRVLTSAGALADGFHWADPSDSRDVREVLQAEDLSFSSDGFASPEARFDCGGPGGACRAPQGITR